MKNLYLISTVESTINMTCKILWHFTIMTNDEQIAIFFFWKI